MAGRLLVGDCRARLKDLDDNSIDAIITDPPYELGFMGKRWDASGIAYDPEVWEECFRVLKPGGHVVAAGGTRTYHRMTVAIEDAGFDIRDAIHWTYGEGMPKSHNVGKAIDKAAGAERTVVIGWTNKGIPPGSNKAVGHGEGSEPTPITAPVTEEAVQWNGWGTALKPSHEPFVVARKPLSGTVARNVLEWGTGALNIDGCRIGPLDRHDGSPNLAGRWPANTVLTHAWGCDGACVEGCPVRDLDRRSTDASRYFTATEWAPEDFPPFLYYPKPSKAEKNAGCDGLPVSRPDDRTTTGMGTFDEKGVQPQQNSHPTVKPVALMRHLIRLVTPPGGTVLDPFLGSGTTAVAATLEGMQWVGCELTEEYVPIIEARVAWAEGEVAAGRAAKPRYKAPKAPKAKADQPELFG